MMLLGDLQHSEQIFRASWHSVTQSRSSSLFALNVSLQAQSQKPLTWHSLKSSWNFQECHPVLLITETRGEDLIITEVRKSVSWRSEVCPNYNCWGAHEPEPERCVHFIIKIKQKKIKPFSTSTISNSQWWKTKLRVNIITAPTVLPSTWLTVAHSWTSWLCELWPSLITW